MLRVPSVAAYATVPEAKHTLKEIRLKVDVENVAAQALDRVIEGENVNTFAVLDIQARVHVHHVTELHAEIVTSDLVHLNLALLDIVGAQADQNSIVALLPAVRDVR